MRTSRIIGAGFFIGVLFLLGIVGTTNIAQAQQYLGCYKDQGDPVGTSGRDLDGFVLNAGDMTTARCISECRSRGFSYAGTQYSNYCFCGNSYGKSGAADNCNMPCAGNASEVCGGGWANSVYAVGSGTNRPPNAPALLTPPNTPTWSPPVNPSVAFQWRGNGDPDGDTVSFYINVYQWNSASQQWSTVYNNWVSGTSLTLNLQPGSYYTWGVYAADRAQRSNPWYTFSGWSYFSTSAASPPQAKNPWDTYQGQSCFERWIAYAMSPLELL